MFATGKAVALAEWIIDDTCLVTVFFLSRFFGDTYNYAFPYFLYPLTNVILCYSIFLVMAIAFERFLAVCYPYDYRAMASTQTVSKRVMKLTLPIFVVAVIINIPKFLETELVEKVGVWF